MKRVQLADIFQSSMVLQREKPIHIWGTAKPGIQLLIQLGDTAVTCDVTEESFHLELPPMAAGRDKTLSVTVNQEPTPEILLHDISIGDVYLAGGQSNMEYFLRYEAHFEELRLESENPDIHMYNVPQIAFEGQQRSLPEYGYWFTKNDPAWRVFSAIGYLFAREIQPEIGIPIGIIGCNWGGSSVACWIEESYLTSDPLTCFQKEYEAATAGKSAEELEEESRKGWEYETSYQHQLEWRTMMYGLTLEEQDEWTKMHQNEPAIPMGPYHAWRPHGLFHTMIEKVAPLQLKGVLWYQGESESDEVKSPIYDQAFRALTDCWRDTWNDPELPFFTVQLAPFKTWLGCFGDLYPSVRESQERAAKTIPGVYMTSIMDLGMYEDIHPKEKKEIARRLALLALQHLYHVPIDGENPGLLQAIRRSNQLIFWFDHTADGLWIDGDMLHALTLTQNGQPLTPANVETQDDKLILTFDALSSETIEAAFAWSAYCKVNLYNSENLPVKPFRCTM